MANVLTRGFLRDSSTDVLAVTTSTVGMTWQNGFRRAPTGELVVTTSTVGATPQGGFLRAPTGELVINSGGAGTPQRGYLRDTAGALCVATTGQLPDTLGFARNAAGALVVSGLSAGIAKVQTFSKAGTASVATETVPITADTTIGNTMVVMVVATGGRTISSATDSRGNTYTVHYISGNGSFVGCSILTAPLTTALLNGDTITLTPNVACFIGAVAVEYSGMAAGQPRTDAANGQGWLASTAATGGTTAGSSTAGDLVLGVFAGDNANNIATPGAGYTNETGIATVGTVVTLDWESKTAAGGSTEAATATWSGSANGAGGTIAFAAA